MAALTTILAGGAAALVPFIVRYVLVGVGFALVSYTGVMLAFEQVEDLILGSLNGLPPDLYAVLGMAGFPKGIQILLSAYSTVIGLKITFGGANPIFGVGGK